MLERLVAMIAQFSVLFAHPTFHNSKSSLALFTAYSVRICYGQAAEGEDSFTCTQARNNKSSSKSAFNPYCTFGALRVSPQHHCR